MAFKSDEKMMEGIWNNLPKSPDPDHITLTDDDLEDLWDHGFVDTGTYPLDAWVKAFEPNRNPGGEYILTKLDFLEKIKYRYTGEIMMPFEAMLINEGKYTDEGLQELIDQSIAPSCSLTKMEIQEFFEVFKENYREDDGMVRMDMAGKREIEHLIAENPSPTRQRELLFDAIFSDQIGQALEDGAEIVRATPEQTAKIQISTFTTLPSSRSEAALKELKSIEKVKSAAATGSGDEGVSVKKVKKSRKGFRG